MALLSHLTSTRTNHLHQPTYRQGVAAQGSAGPAGLHAVSDRAARSWIAARRGCLPSAPTSANCRAKHKAPPQSTPPRPTPTPSFSSCELQVLLNHFSAHSDSGDDKLDKETFFTSLSQGERGWALSLHVAWRAFSRMAWRLHGGAVAWCGACMRPGCGRSATRMAHAWQLCSRPAPTPPDPPPQRLAAWRSACCSTSTRRWTRTAGGGSASARCARAAVGVRRASACVKIHGVAALVRTAGAWSSRVRNRNAKPPASKPPPVCVRPQHRVPRRQGGRPGLLVQDVRHRQVGRPAGWFRWQVGWSFCRLLVGWSVGSLVGRPLTPRPRPRRPRDGFLRPSDIQQLLADIHSSVRKDIQVQVEQVGRTPLWWAPRTQWRGGLGARGTGCWAPDARGGCG
jgi:hypothetical protein